MKYRKLGNTDLDVSLIGLGTMTYGEQNSEADAHAQLDLALELGVNLVDTAEMYPVPPMAATQGLTEQYIGTWLAKTGRRTDIVLASKIAGPQRDPKRPGHIRNGTTSLDRKNLEQALHDSLRRLQTDYLDLYQLHWPDRSTVTFGQRSYPWKEEDTVPIEETLAVLDDFVRQGKVRHIGVSNETPWGVARFLELARSRSLPLIATIQNPYNLLNRVFEEGLSEFCRYDSLGLLAYSPLAMGVLTGKYDHGARPEKGRLTLYERFTRYDAPRAREAALAYNELAREHGLTPTQLALAWVNQQVFTSSNLIGATTLEQLRENIASVDVQLSDELITKVNAIHHHSPNPAP